MTSYVVHTWKLCAHTDDINAKRKKHSTHWRREGMNSKIQKFQIWIQVALSRRNAVGNGAATLITFEGDSPLGEHQLNDDSISCWTQKLFVSQKCHLLFLWFVFRLFSYCFNVSTRNQPFWSWHIHIFCCMIIYSSLFLHDNTESWRNSPYVQISASPARRQYCSLSLSLSLV